MKATQKNQVIKYLKTAIAGHETTIEMLSADLKVMEENPPEIPTWYAFVSSAWSSEGEPDWSGTFDAPDLKTAVYHAMLCFCKKAGRVYPGYVSKSLGGKAYDHFDLQGTVYIYMRLPNGSTISADTNTVGRFKKQFNKKAPEPPKPKRRQPEGIT